MVDSRGLGLHVGRDMHLTNANIVQMRAVVTDENKNVRGDKSFEEVPHRLENRYVLRGVQDLDALHGRLKTGAPTPYQLMRFKKAVPSLNESPIERCKAHEKGVMALGFQKSTVAKSCYPYASKATGRLEAVLRTHIGNDLLIASDWWYKNGPNGLKPTFDHRNWNFDGFVHLGRRMTTQPLNGDIELSRNWSMRGVSVGLYWPKDAEVKRTRRYHRLSVQQCQKTSVGWLDRIDRTSCCCGVDESRRPRMQRSVTYQTQIRMVFQAKKNSHPSLVFTKFQDETVQVVAPCIDIRIM